MDLGLDGRVAIVTGATRGLGRASALALRDEGVRVLASGRDAALLRSLTDETDGAVATEPCDLREPSRAARLVDVALERFGRIDILVNCAGVAVKRSFLAHDPEDWETTLAVNLMSPVLLTRAVGEHFLTQRSGKVVNVASTAGLRGKASIVAYAAAKGALIQFTKSVAAEWGPSDVQVNAIAPGAFATDMQRAVFESPERLARRVESIPARRLGEAEEIGPLVCFLASPRSRFVTGSVFTVDGGEVDVLFGRNDE